MNILDDTIKYYSNQIIDDFKKSDIYKKINDEVANLNCKIIVDCNKSINLRDKNIYLGITFFDEYDNPIEIYDEGQMSVSQCIVRVDKKDRYCFNYWHQDEFIEDIDWIIKKITEIKK